MAAPCHLGMYITTVEHRLLRDDGCATASLPDAPSHPRKFLECRETVKQEHRDIHIGRGKINCRHYRFLRVCARGSTNGSALHRNWHSSIRITAWAAWALFSLQYFPDTTSESPNPVFYLLTGTKWRTRAGCSQAPGPLGVIIGYKTVMGARNSKLDVLGVGQGAKDKPRLDVRPP